jgi:hypothetical protein
MQLHPQPRLRLRSAAQGSAPAPALEPKLSRAFLSRQRNRIQEGPSGSCHSSTSPSAGVSDRTRPASHPDPPAVPPNWSKASCQRPWRELFLNGAVEAFADSVGPWMPGFGAAVIDVLYRQIQLVFVVFALTAVLSKELVSPLTHSAGSNGVVIELSAFLRSTPLVPAFALCACSAGSATDRR